MSTDEPGSKAPPGPGEGGPRRRRRRRGRRGDGAPKPPQPARTAAEPRIGGDGWTLVGSLGKEPAPPRAPRDERPRSQRDGERRGRRRGRRRGDEATAQTPVGATAAPVVPAVSSLVESGAATEPLTPAEVEEMKHHLVFLREYKEALRLRLNAAEDLLVNGRREPSDRGVCMHLLHKVDRAVIEAAIGREPFKSNAGARARMLAGAIRLTADVGVLLAYLETLAPERSHAEAAQAFAEVVRRIDFESLSATRLARLLQVLTETFRGHERVQVLFGMLDGAPFRRAFDAAEPALPPDVAAAFAPLRAVHRRLLGETDPAAAGADRDRLAVGLEQVMAAPDAVLRGYAEPLRVRMLELALDPSIPPALADRAAGVLLTSLGRTGKTFTRLAMRRAAQLLARHVDDRARAALEEVRRAAPGFHAAERWLAALAARRMGRIALTAGPPERGRLHAGFWLDGQRPVWLRTAPATAADAVAREAAAQATLALPGVAPVVEHGVASGIPYVAVAAPGRPWQLEGVAPADLVAQAARILRAVALVGVALPDARPERFCLANERTPVLTLADLDGAEVVDRDEAAARNFQALAALVPADLGTRADLPALIAAIDRAPRRALDER
jgi:hypothetical protein